MKTIEVTAPGSLMICGEHAVLNGYKSIACAVDKFMTVKLTPRKDELFSIKSTLGKYKSCINNPEQHDVFQFIIAAVKLLEPKKGFDLVIESQFSHQVGLGSSAAVTVATCTALTIFKGHKFSHNKVFHQSLQCVLNVQGRGSGSDLAASVYGGIVSLKIRKDERRHVLPLDCPLPPIDLVYCGYKMRTHEVIKVVEQKREVLPELYDRLYKMMGKTTEEVETSLKDGDWERTGTLFNFYHGLMDALGVCDQKLAKIAYGVRRLPDIYGSKISGSGLGDCVISLGKIDHKLSVGSKIDVNIAPEGVVYYVY